MALNKKPISKDNILTHAILITGAAAMILPFVWMLLTSFKNPQEVLQFPPTWIPSEWRYQNYVDAWMKVRFGMYFFNSCFTSLVATVGMMITSVLAAFAFAYLEFPLKNTIFYVLMGTMMVPQQVLLVPNFMTLKAIGWHDTYLALTVPWMAGFFGIFLLRQFFLTMPRDLYDAARIDGCSRLRFLFTVLVPLSTAPLTTLGVFSFIANWNSFLWPLIMTDRDQMRTLQVGLAFFAQSEGTQWGMLMAASTFCTLPLVIGFFIAQKQFIEGIAHSGSKE
jgi:multiple sugar transport system permease protein